MNHSGNRRGPHEASLTETRLLHLADSALPIGSLAHSFGLETLTDSGRLKVTALPAFFRAIIEECGFVDAVFCRAGHSLGRDSGTFCAEQWLACNERLSAIKPGREARQGSAVLGRNFLQLIAAVENLPVVKEALNTSASGGGSVESKPAMIHHSIAFGLAGGALGIEADRTVLAFLHQTTANLISACQRLLPLGQTEATRVLWNLKPVMIETAARSVKCAPEEAYGFTPLLDWGAMQHPALTTRLFIS